MTKIFRYTDTVTAASVSGTGPFPAGTPFNTGTARPRPTTRQGIFDEIALALVAAGWTEYQKVAGERHVYESSGEDGTENICIELNHLSTDRYLHFNLGLKLDGSDELDAKIGNNVSTGGSADLNGRWDLTASNFTSDFFIVASKDGLFAFFQNINHTSTCYWVSIGLGLRTHMTNVSKYATSGVVSSGDNVVLTPASGNPLADGYRPGDLISIVEIAKASSPKVDSLLVTGVTATTITVLKLPRTYAAGALFGANPSPLYRGVASNEFPDSAMWSTPIAQYTVPVYAGSGHPLDGDLFTTAVNGSVLDEIHFPGNVGYDSFGEYGSGTTPNKRTQRFTCRNITLSGTAAGIHCLEPFLVTYPGTVSLYPHDWYKADRLSPPQYYVAFRPTATTGQRWGVGPIL